MLRTFDNDYAKGHIEPVDSIISENKKRNMEYWDGVEAEVEDAFITVASAGGVHITDLREMIDVKELTEEIMKRVKTQFPEADWPYVDEDC